MLRAGQHDGEGDSVHLPERAARVTVPGLGPKGSLATLFITEAAEILGTEGVWLELPCKVHMGRSFQRTQLE